MNAPWFFSVVFSIAQGSPSTEPSSRPGSAAIGGAHDLKADVTLAFRLSGEQEFTIEEFWKIQNPDNKRVPKDALTIKLPRGARRLILDEQSEGFEASDDAKRIVARQDLSASSAEIGARYFLGFHEGTFTMRRVFPVSTGTVRVIFEHAPDLELKSSQQFQRHERDMGGQRFTVYVFGALPKDAPLALEVSGLPSRSAWPRHIAILLCIAVLFWVALSLRKKASAPLLLDGPLSAQARRDQLVRAVGVLNRDYEATRVKERRYTRRHRELVEELGRVLQEIEVSKDLQK